MGLCHNTNKNSPQWIKSARLTRGTLPHSDIEKVSRFAAVPLARPFSRAWLDPVSGAWLTGCVTCPCKRFGTARLARSLPSVWHVPNGACLTGGVARACKRSRTARLARSLASIRHVSGSANARRTALVLDFSCGTGSDASRAVRSDHLGRCTACNAAQSQIVNGHIT